MCTYIYIYIHTYSYTYTYIIYLCSENVNASYVTYDTGRRRPIGCLKLLVIFRKRATNHRALLWKMTCEDKASCVTRPPCSH